MKTSSLIMILCIGKVLFQMYHLIKIPFARKQKDTVAILCVICILFSWSCQTKNLDDEIEKFCSYINEENIDKTIPIVNQFLSGLSAELDGERQLQELAAWLKSCPCIIDAAVLTQSTPTSEIVVSFDENGTTYQYIMDVSMEKPLKIVGYRAYDQHTVWWSILVAVVCIECPVQTQFVYFDGDSIVADYSYKKVFSCNDKLHKNIKYEGLIREQEKKTYFIPNNFKKEYILYDFSLEEGMSFEYVEPQVIPEHEYTQTFYVKKIDFVEINGIKLKQFQLSTVSEPDYGSVCATWIEKIGSLNGLFHPCGILAPGVKRELLCFSQNNELFYKNPVYSDCYYYSWEDVIWNSKTSKK